MSSGKGTPTVDSLLLSGVKKGGRHPKCNVIFQVK